MSSVLLTDQHITMEALAILENSLSFTKTVNRQYEKEFKNAYRGATVYARKPPRYTVRDGQAVAIQDTVQTQVPVTLQHQFGVDVQFYSADLELSIEAFSQKVLEPQIVQIANAVDFAGLSLALQVPNVVGTAGTTPGTGATAQAALAVYGSAKAMLDKTATPRDGRRNCLINEDAESVTVPNLAGLLNPTTSISKQYTDGTMGKALGLNFSMSQNVNVFTAGAQAGTPQVATAPTPATQPFGTTLTPASGQFTPNPASSAQTFSVSTKGWTASTQIFNGGEVVYFANCYMVNPLSKQNAGKLKGFVVSGPITSDGSGNATLTLTEPMITAGAYQNVTAVPTVNAAITFGITAGTASPQNLAYHRDAFTLACVDLPVPGGVHMAARKSDDQLGLSLRFVAQYDIRTDLFIGRFDLLCGWAALRPEWAVRILG
ncbi:MAG TPA: P22 phage major capsid protein family protein [Bryobacteraceae bacterium]|nr:P22 phage major capsid protein family protein [Bryobacteraceae bacterium]